MSVSAIEYQFIARELAEKNAKYAVRSGFVLFSAGIKISIRSTILITKYLSASVLHKI